MTVRVVRIIARLNIGGPAIQAITLTRRLSELGYSTLLVRGAEGPDEGNMDQLAASLDVRPLLVPWMRRNPSWRDVLALAALVRLLRHDRPEIVHTHAAKAGTLGRVAAFVAFPRRRNRPVLVHTYHGHSLSGYFAPRTAGLYRTIERALARVSDRLIAVSQEVKDELVALGVAPASKFEVVPLGFDLDPFVASPAIRAALRQQVRTELGIPLEAPVVTLVARLVPIKRVDRFLAIAAALGDQAAVRFVIVGNGELREKLASSPDAAAHGDRLIWAGFRSDMPAIYVASDIVVQTSDNEGTPVALIEAQAASVPVVSTRVGGTPSVVVDGETGWLLEPDDVHGFADRVRRLLEDHDARLRMGKAGRQRARERFGVEQLVDRIDDIYGRLLAQRA